MNRKRYGISGIGIAISAGSDLDTLYSSLSQGKPLFQNYQIFADDSLSYPVSRVDEEALDHGLSIRQLKKLDRFTIFSLTAARQALQDAGIEVNSEFCKYIGMMVGNCTAGWTYVEPMMYSLYTEGMEAVNSYVATAWFPAAPQGEISILYGLGGHSKTVSADRLSSGLAIAQSIQVLNSGHVEMMLAGGAEAPLNSLVFNAFLQTNLLSPSGSYFPFSSTSDGNLLGEGSVFLAIETIERAYNRGIVPHCEILAVGQGHSLTEAIYTCLTKAIVTPEDVDYIVLDGAGSPEKDDEEYAVIAEVFAANQRVWLSSPKSIYGELLGANIAASVAVACLSLEKQTVFPTVSDSQSIKPSPVGKHVIGNPEPATLNYILINGRDFEGRGIAILLSKI